ncbi:hypothetical protein KP509_33G026300 [Ceratopteris richardii]|nr:hypothetical protein KP509_33G026300 [Ceratopteris richardii]
MKTLCGWVNRKIFLYNVTFGLYMLDWWERLLFNFLVLLLIWFLGYNSWRYTANFLRGSFAMINDLLISRQQWRLVNGEG